MTTENQTLSLIILAAGLKQPVEVSFKKSEAYGYLKTADQQIAGNEYKACNIRRILTSRLTNPKYEIAQKYIVAMALKMIELQAPMFLHIALQCETVITLDLDKIKTDKASGILFSPKTTFRE